MEIYQLPDEARHFPRPLAPMLPQFSFSQLSRQKQPNRFSRFLDEDALFLPSGRVAMYYALTLLGVTKGTEVLVPAYHCGSMIEPIIYLGATPRFYHLDPHLVAHPAELERQISAGTKVVLLPHLFGFPQNTAAIKQLCGTYGIALIEDCAHSFYGTDGSMRLGSTGDFAITSTVKFFPGIEGGVLVANRRSQRIEALIERAPSFIYQVKNCLHTLENAAQYKRLGWLGKLLSLRNPPNLAKPNAVIPPASPPSTRRLEPEALHWFTPNQIGLKASWCTQLLTRHSDAECNISRRRSNFNDYLRRLSDCPGIRPLHHALPSDIAPYVFPLLLDNPQTDFPRLKHQGVPIWRWEELVISDCPVSNDYRLRLIQLPCHQSLEQQEIDWIINTLIGTTSQASY